MKIIHGLLLAIALLPLSGCNKNYVEIGTRPKMKINPPASMSEWGAEYLHSDFQSNLLSANKLYRVDKHASDLGIVSSVSNIKQIRSLAIIQKDLTVRMEILGRTPITEYAAGNEVKLTGYRIGGQSKMAFFPLDVDLLPGRYQTPLGNSFDYKISEYEQTFVQKAEAAFQAKAYQDAFNFASTVESFPSLAQHGKRMAEIKAEVAFRIAEDMLKRRDFEAALSYAEEARVRGFDAEAVAVLRRYIQLKKFWVGFKEGKALRTYDGITYPSKGAEMDDKAIARYGVTGEFRISEADFIKHVLDKRQNLEQTFHNNFADYLAHTSSIGARCVAVALKEYVDGDDSKKDFIHPLNADNLHFYATVLGESGSAKYVPLLMRALGVGASRDPDSSEYRNYAGALARLTKDDKWSFFDVWYHPSGNSLDVRDAHNGVMKAGNPNNEKIKKVLRGFENARKNSMGLEFTDTPQYIPTDSDSMICRYWLYRPQQGESGGEKVHYIDVKMRVASRGQDHRGDPMSSWYIEDVGDPVLRSKD